MCVSFGKARSTFIKVHHFFSRAGAKKKLDTFEMNE